MKTASHLNRIPACLDQIEVLLHVPRFVAEGNREAAFHVRVAITHLIQAIRVRRGLPPQKSSSLTELLHGDGATIRGIGARDPWRERLEPFLDLPLPRSRIRDLASQGARPFSSDELRSIVERLRDLASFARRDLGVGTAPPRAAQRAVTTPSGIFRTAAKPVSAPRRAS